MRTELINGLGNVYLTIEYQVANHWVYNNWIGHQTYLSIVDGSDACLHPLQDNCCPYLLNDNRQVVGAWDYAMEWSSLNWAPRASAAGLTHIAHITSPESLAAVSAEALHLGIGTQLEMRMFSNLYEAQAWLRDAQQQAHSLSISPALSY